ncbi:MAG: TlpA family protein disulfide reductase [Sphingobacteriales bacterium]|jgi:thiol-disulfide isomerase/thioredoxin|nr:TlpA family protein disulfide reductase [Sphingobacteriales bacterium]MBP9140326.1 TlpA family protein disulfide reductase [Chitinophagales bacterium]MDA0198770.1 TlpA disulfide reductase family protein [Bacteroidota bacterium]MBK7526777.1 TlpA family protein disulfide reductase [Sphingobacteriales bacterium]MBK8677264.1 TlpA family protein disulfide reductase [Sphingobacteriales bacterium]
MKKLVFFIAPTIFQLLAISCLLFLFLIYGCNTNNTTAPQAETPQQNADIGNNASRQLLTGLWRAKMDLPGPNNDSFGASDLPFNFELAKNNNGQYVMTIINGPERIEVTDFTFKDDSVFIKFPYYNSEIKAQFNERRILGEWHNYAKGPNYYLPVYCVLNDSARFQVSVVDLDLPVNVNGKWEVQFIATDRKSKTDALAEFKQNQNHVVGTFLTPSGDYRYMEGTVTNKGLMLSCFDGAHAFLAKGKLDEAGNIMGEFWSGNHLHEEWWASPDPEGKAIMPNPETQTKSKKANTQLSFSLPNVNGQTVSLSDPKYKNKAVIVQIMGSWCPNCTDETKLLVDLYNKYNAQGLEVIALAFETQTDPAQATEQLKKYANYFKIPYEVLLAGQPNKQGTAKALPELTEIKGYPTTIYIDRNGKIAKIYTGFNGPATSKYQAEAATIAAFIEKLLHNEPV